MGLTALGKADEKNTGKMGKILEKLMKNTGKMQKILEKFMKKYWENAKKTGKVREIRQSKKVGTMTVLSPIMAPSHNCAPLPYFSTKKYTPKIDFLKFKTT